MSHTYSIVGQKWKGFDPYLPGITPGTEVLLVREPDNEHDRNAVAVWIDGQAVGYIPKTHNAALAQFIDQSGSEVAVPDERKIATDSKFPPMKRVRAVVGLFSRSKNSAYPQVEV